MSNQGPKIDLDLPLLAGTALEQDRLSRCAFAKSAVASLRNVTSTAGFVLSVEGAWGSGKTSALAMIEALLLQEPEPQRPIVVHFNPWLVGERDALLRQYLAKIASAIKLADNAKEGRKVAKELTTYAKAFDIIKLIPGAEPWATIVKSVVESVGNATNSIAEYKTPDIEERKQRVEACLRKYPRPIIVFIDDIDRLFPLEVFEMVRIVKAVGNLPHVGYVLAWDPRYVSSALKSADVPQSESYLDKIVQVRMQLPSLSRTARERLFNDAFETLSPEACKSYFHNDGDRLSQLYFAGLRDLLELPRDFSRVFNTVRVIEPPLRGELVLSDIIGLAALMEKAPAVFDVLRKNPQWFVGCLPREYVLSKKPEEIIKDALEARETAFNACAMPAATRRVVHFLFPLVAKAEDEFSFNSVVEVEGHIGHPTRLLVALQLSASPYEVSLVLARRYLTQPEERATIGQSLSVENCVDFIEQLGDLARLLEGQSIANLEQLCISMARLVDSEPYLTRSKHREGTFTLSAARVAINAISEIVRAVEPKHSAEVSKLLIEDECGLTLAAQLIAMSYFSKKDDHDNQLIAASDNKPHLIKKFADNVLQAAENNGLMNTSDTGTVLWVLSRAYPVQCKMVFAAMKSADPTLDGFALEFLKHSFDSHKGQTYALPQEIDRLEVFCPIDVFREHAEGRMLDTLISYPAKAAWLSVLQGKTLYGKDGTESSH